MTAAPPVQYAGLTPAAAIAKAASGLVALEVAFNGVTLAKAAQTRRALDDRRPTLTRSACHGAKAWRVTWPASTPVFVNQHGLMIACMTTVKK